MQAISREVYIPLSQINIEIPEQELKLEKIFENSLEKLNERITYCKIQKNRMVYIAATLGGGGLIGSLITAVTTSFNNISPEFIISYSTMSSSMIFTIIGSVFLQIEQNAKKVLECCSTFTCLYAAIRDFESDPQEAKIKKIFDQFESLSKKLQNNNPFFSKNLIEDNNVCYFMEDGKYYLMDSLTKSLELNNIQSYVCDSWKKNLTNFSCDEPWQSIGISKPSANVYLRYLAKKDKKDVRDLAETMLTIMKSALYIGLSKGDI